MIKSQMKTQKRNCVRKTVYLLAKRENCVCVVRTLERETCL